MRKNYAKLLKSLSDLLTDNDFIEKYSTSPKHFTRNRKLPFRTVTVLILQLLKASVRTELKNFHQKIFPADEICNWVTDSAFCRARQKIKPALFIELYRFVARSFYAREGVKRWHHFRLLAVDGSEIQLPSSKELIEKFGCHSTNAIGTKIPHARISLLCDALNRITLDAQIEPFKTSEQTMFESHLAWIGKNDLLTADGNYGHFRIFKAVLARKADFCIRMSCSSDFVKDFLASGEKDSVLIWEPSESTLQNCKKYNIDPSPLTIRLVRIELSDNEVEVLALSLLDRQVYTYDDIRDLYFKRWAVEEEFKKFIQRLTVELFSSVKENGVLQDFYANVFMLNFVTFHAEPVAIIITDKSLRRKYRQQINWTSAFGDVRGRLAVLFFRDIQKIESVLESLRASFMANTEAIKPSRKFPRDKKKKGSRKKSYIAYKPAW